MTKQYISYYDASKKEADSAELATKDRAGLMSKEDKAKLDSINIEGSQISTSIEANKIVQDNTHRLVSDVQITAWNSKADRTLASTSAPGLMSKEDKAKLDNIESGGNNYTHPDTHPATMIVEDSFHRFVTDVEKTRWNTKADTTMASTSANGLMSKEDKSKLDNLSTILGSSGNNIQASSIEQDESHQFITTEQVTKINNLPTGYTVDFDDSDSSVSIIPIT